MNVHPLDTPIGRLRLVSDGESLLRIEFEHRYNESADDVAHCDAVLAATSAQLRAYFAGQRKQFDLPLAPQGTEFQRQVWQALVAIPYGRVCSYRDLAHQLNKPKAVRAVGAANGRNPIPIVIPCHRVIGSDGSLTGFAGGLALKRRLLTLEGHPQLAGDSQQPLL